MRFDYFLQLNGDSDQGQSTGRPEDGHKTMEPRKNKVTGWFWGWKGGSWSGGGWRSQWSVQVRPGLSGREGR